MSIAVLHLSDIHVADKSDPILERAEQIVAALRPYLPNAEGVLILVTGDIAQSGQASEYALAELLLYEITDLIQNETNATVDVVVAPGNHDCDFSGNQEVRALVIAAAQKSGVTDGLIEKAVEVQRAYAAFQKSVSASIETSASDPLWATHRVEIAGHTVVIDSLNASWMSTRHEQQGGLIFPFEMYKGKRDLACDVRLVLLHHPFNWYNQSNYHQFRGYIQHLADFVFTGHEHQSAGREIDDAVHGMCRHIEGAVLQSRSDRTLSGLNVLLLDTATSTYRYIPFRFENDAYTPTSLGQDWESFRSAEKKSANAFQLTETFQNLIEDPGATLGHPSGISLKLQDIYVYPDLDSRTEPVTARRRGRAVPKYRAQNLLDIGTIEQDILLEGRESSGKTRLLYSLYSTYHRVGLLPLLIRGRDIRKPTASDIDKLVRNAAAVQYGARKVEEYLQTPKVKRILLLDDLDHSALRGAARVAAVSALKAYFSRSLVAVGENFELAEFVEGEAESGATSGRQYKQYRISPFGYERRAELVRKWISIGNDGTQTVNDGLKVFDEAQALIEGTRLQHIVPSAPIYVLSLLQASVSGMSKELRNSSFAHYYHMLIVSALERGGVKPEEMNAFIAACTHLSWFIHKNGDDQRVSQMQYEEFVHSYSEVWTKTDAKALLRVLTTTRVLKHDGDAIAFAYPYAYYYFLGRYASVSIHDSEVIEYVGHCVRNLYVRECANTLLFLAHHSGHGEVLSQLIASIRSHFADRNPMTLSRDDIAGIEGLMSAAPRITFKARAPSAYRDEIAKHKDETDAGDGLVDKPSVERDFFDNLISLSKSLEIVGTLLTHQFPNYRNAEKNDAVKEVFDGALRATREIYSHFEADSESLIKVLTERISKRSNVPLDKAEQQTRLAIGMLLRAITTSFLTMAAGAVRSPVLVAHVEAVLGTEPSFAYRLIRLAQQLQTPNRLPRVEVEKLLKEEGTNPCVAGPLQLLMLQRLYMYETDHDDRDWAISTLQLGGFETALHAPGDRKWKPLNQIQ